MSIWTPHISSAESGGLTSKYPSLITSIFPERDNTCHFQAQTESDEGVLCKTPLGWQEGKQLAGLITLRGFIDGGYDVPEAKILVCVKSIGGRKRCKSADG